MTERYNPRHEWATQPQLDPMTPLVDGDLCDIRVVGKGYCHKPGLHAAMDADGATRILCAEHVALYFPNSTAA